ncbi:MAG: Mor transcription activator family protein [Enterococcus sp.]
MKEDGEVYSWNQVYKELVSLVGKDATLKIYEQYKGNQVHFPMRLIDSQFLGDEVLHKFNGRNLKQLARYYGYSERHLQRILKKEKDKKGKYFFNYKENGRK